MKRTLTVVVAAAFFMAGAPLVAQSPSDVQVSGWGGRVPMPRPPMPRPPMPHPRPPMPRPPMPHPRPPQPRPPMPRPPAPTPRPPQPHPRPPRPPQPQPWPGHRHPRPYPVPLPLPWPYPYPQPPCRWQPCSPNEVFTSPDGTRAVWIQGEARDAYLYDRTPGGFEPRLLDWEVFSVDFLMNGGSLSGIELTLEDGRRELFDVFGDRVGEQSSGAAPAAVLPPHRDLSKPLGASPAFQALKAGSPSWN